ncbi:MAG: hypothetical protein E7647_08195 [Ruminococcaceae bacterium]|nr:hypothetical protein [Oscillospiraceae bacterium]
MKKFRIFAMVLMLFVAIAVFTGCNKLKTEDVEKDPVNYVMEGSKLTLSESEFSPVIDPKDKIAYELKLKGEGQSSNIGLYLDTKEQKGSVDISSKTSYASDFGDESYSQETNIDAAIFYEDKKIVVKSEMLEDVIGTDAVGLDLGFTYDELKESGIWELLEQFGAITEESTGAIETLLESDGLTKLFTGYVEGLQKLAEEQYEVGEVEETTVKIGDKEIKAIAVSMSVNEDIYADIMEKTGDLLVKLSNLIGEEMTEEDKEALMSTLNDSIPEMSGDYTYYLSKKTGALIKMEAETKSETTLEFMGESETEKSECSFEIVFGEDPTEKLLPSFTLEYSQKSEYVDNTIKIEAESREEDGKFIMEGKGTAESDGEKSTTELTFEYENGEFTLSGKDDDDNEYEISGEIESSENEFKVKLDLSKAYGEDEDLYGVPTEIELSVTYGEDVPKLPEYKDILDFTVEDLSMLLGGVDPDFGYDADYDEDISIDDYDELFKLDMELYLETDADGVAAELAKYAENGFESEEEYLYYLFVVYTYADLTTNYGAGEAAIDEFMNDIKNNGGTTYDIAVALYDAYYDLAVPTEEEVRDYLDNYEDYGYSSLEEAIDDLRDYYGEYLIIPEEYLTEE